MKKPLWLMAAFYYMLFAGGAFSIYATLYYHDVGLTTSEIGFIGGLPPVIAVAAQPFWGLIADRFGARSVLIGCLLAGAAVYSVFPSVHSFVGLFVLSMIAVLITNPINPIVDSTALSLLSDREKYGNLRLFGSLGYAISAWLGGRLLSPHHYGTLYYFVATAYVFNVVLSMKLPATLDRKTKVTIVGAWKLVSTGRMPLFLASCSLTMMAVSGNWMFFSLWLTGHGGTTKLVGVAFLVEATLEVPVFMAISRFRAYLPDALLLWIGSVAYIVRFTLLSQSVPLWLVLATQFLPGLGFTAIYAAQVNYMDKHTPDGLKATGQTILSVAGMGGIGTLLGGVVMGFIAQRWNISTAYATSAALLIAGLPLFLLFRSTKQVQSESSLSA